MERWRKSGGGVCIGEDESPQDSKELVPKSWSVSVENCAVRDTGRSLEEGQDTLSAALMIGTLDWATPSGDVQVWKNSIFFQMIIYGLTEKLQPPLH